MKSDSETELKQELNYLTIKNIYDGSNLTFAVNFKTKLLWYVDTTSKVELIKLEFEKFFDKNNNFINE
jgi:hypothetical protein